MNPDICKKCEKWWMLIKDNGNISGKEYCFSCIQFPKSDDYLSWKDYIIDSGEKYYINKKQFSILKKYSNKYNNLFNKTVYFNNKKDINNEFISIFKNIEINNDCPFKLEHEISDLNK